jgi:hypothetical protein
VTAARQGWVAGNPVTQPWPGRTSA